VALFLLTSPLQGLKTFWSLPLTALPSPLSVVQALLMDPKHRQNMSPRECLGVLLPDLLFRANDNAGEVCSLCIARL
jgi:hypothetical protein